MSSPFLAEIRVFGFNFAPKGWAQCNGQLIPISQNTALFALLGTFYGGDGKSTFALPNMQGSVPMHWGQSSTGTQYDLGQQSGTPFVTLLDSEMPFHTHTLTASVITADGPNPTGAYTGRPDSDNIYAVPANLTTMAFQALPPAGGSLPHNNLMPYLVLNFCIAMQGVFPPRQ